MNVTLDVRTEGVHSVVSVRGQVDVHTARELRRRFADLIGAGRHHLVIDLEEVEFVDSTGLGVLVGVLKRIRNVGGSLSLVCSRENILTIFRITALDGVFSIEGDVAAAVAATGERLLRPRGVRMPIGC